MEFKKVEYNFNPSGNTINLVEGENLKDLTSNLKSSTTVTSTVGQPVIKLTYVHNGAEKVAYLPFLDGTGKVRRIIESLITKTVETVEMDYEVYKVQEKAQLKGNLKVAKINYKNNKTEANKQLIQDAKGALKASKKKSSADYKAGLATLTNNLKNEVCSFNSKTTHTKEESKRAFEALVQIQKNEGLNITNDTPRITKVKVFNGIKKVAKAPFRFVKNHKKGVVAIALAGVIGFTANHIFSSKNKSGNNNTTSKTRQEQMTNNDYNYYQEQDNIISNIPSNTYTNDDPYYYEQNSNTNNYHQEEYTNNYQEQNNVIINYETYRNYEQALAKYGYTYNDIVEGYTFILNASNPAYANLSLEQIDKYINAGDCLLEEKCLRNDYDCSNAAINAINNGVEASAKFLEKNNAFSGGTLIDYMTVGRKTHDNLFNSYKNGLVLAEDVDNFRNIVYLPGLGIYEQLITNGSLGNQKTYK